MCGTDSKVKVSQAPDSQWAIVCTLWRMKNVCLLEHHFTTEVKDQIANPLTAGEQIYHLSRAQTIILDGVKSYNVWYIELLPLWYPGSLLLAAHSLYSSIFMLFYITHETVSMWFLRCTGSQSFMFADSINKLMLLSNSRAEPLENARKVTFFGPPESFAKTSTVQQH